MDTMLEMRKDLAGLVLIIVLFMMDYLKIDDPSLKFTLMGLLGALFGFGAAQTAVPALNNGTIAKITAANPPTVVVSPPVTAAPEPVPFAPAPAPDPVPAPVVTVKAGIYPH